MIFALRPNESVEQGECLLGGRGLAGGWADQEVERGSHGQVVDFVEHGGLGGRGGARAVGARDQREHGQADAAQVALDEVLGGVGRLGEDVLEVQAGGEQDAGGLRLIVGRDDEVLQLQGTVIEGSAGSGEGVQVVQGLEDGAQPGAGFGAAERSGGKELVEPAAGDVSAHRDGSAVYGVGEPDGLGSEWDRSQGPGGVEERFQQRLGRPGRGPISAHTITSARGAVDCAEGGAVGGLERRRGGGPLP